MAPLLDIAFRNGPEVALDGVQAILATSANGIRAFARRTLRRDVAVLAVGAQSGETARELGFADVRHAGGDAAALVDLTVALRAPQAGDLLHAAGSETRGDIAGRLTAKGFRVRSEILYDARAPQALPQAAQAALSRQAVDAALFYSPRTAQVFVDLVEQAGLQSACASVLAFAISPAAAAPLRALAFREIRTPARPNQDALLALFA